MIVVADTSPLRYLIVIQPEQLLHAVYGQVIVPAAVQRELTHPRAPEVVRRWMAERPVWLEVREATLRDDEEIALLDEGEQEAIALAEELHADALLIDDWDGRTVAAERHLNVVGTLRFLTEAALLGLTDLKESFELLRQANFRASAQLFERMLDEYSRRR